MLLFFRRLQVVASRAFSIVLPTLTVLLVVGLVLLVSGQAVSAAEWPQYKFDKTHTIVRGPGGYLSWWKLLLLWFVFLFWVKTTDWVSRDCQKNSFPYAIWTSVVFFPFLIVLLLGGLTIPIFLAGWPVTFLGVLVPLLVYVGYRNQRVALHQRVMTPDHIRFMFAEVMGKAGVNVSNEKKADYEKGAKVDFTPLGGSDEKNQANLLTARQMPGYLPAKALLHNAREHRAEKVMIDFVADEVTVRYQVDGVWHDADPRDREEGEALLEPLKQLANLKPDERRARQQGKFVATIEKSKMDCAIVSQGTKSGERVIVQLTSSQTGFKSLEELGMRPKMIEQYKDVMLSDKGIILLSSMPGGGLSTTLNVSLRSTDRLLRDFVSVEDTRDKMEEIENVDPTFYDAQAGETPDLVLAKLLRKEPDVLVVPRLPNAETVSMLSAASEKERLIFGTMRAKEAVEALLRVLLLKVPAEEFAPEAIAVLNQRLVRKLCENCKEAYEPPSSLLKKLGIPGGRVEQFFRHPEEPEEVCTTCHGIGYHGRTAIFELLVVNDEIRDAMMLRPKLDVLRKAARQTGNRSLQDEGIAAVVRGITSLPELMRVLKQ